jgi:hypothetical protein
MRMSVDQEGGRRLNHWYEGREGDGRDGGMRYLVGLD